MAKPFSRAERGEVPPTVARGIDRVLSVQRPIVLAHLRQIRAQHPHATPAEVISILEKRYLVAVTGGGAAVGASAVVPGIGTAAGLALSGVETAGFLEASAMFAQSITEIHGFSTEDPERVRTLVMTMILGSGGVDLIRQLAGQATGGGTRNAFWGELVTKSLPISVLGQVGDRVKSAFLRRFAASQSASVVGRAVPFGIGAVIGGTGNHLLGRKVVNASRTAFGPPPAAFPESLAVVVKPPKAPRASKEKRSRRPEDEAGGKTTPRVLRGPKWAREPDPAVKRMLASGRPAEGSTDPSAAPPPEE